MLTVFRVGHAGHRAVSIGYRSTTIR